MPKAQRRPILDRDPIERLIVMAAALLSERRCLTALATAAGVISDREQSSCLCLPPLQGSLPTHCGHSFLPL